MRSIVLAAVCFVTAFGQEAKPAIDNERVTVWDVTWTKGTTNPARGHDRDAVVLWIDGAKARTASFSPKSDRRDKRGAGRSLVIELKDFPVVPPREQNRISARLSAPAREETA